MSDWGSASLLAWTALAACVACGFARGWHARRHARDAWAFLLGFSALAAASALLVASHRWAVAPLHAGVIGFTLLGCACLLRGMAARAGGHERLVAGYAGVSGVVVLAMLAVAGLGPLGVAASLDAAYALVFVLMVFVGWAGPREHDRLVGMLSVLGAFGFSIRLGIFGAGLANPQILRLALPMAHADLSHAAAMTLLVLLGVILLMAVLEDERAWRARLADYDPLTSLLMRPPFFIDAQSKINAAHDMPHVIAMGDVDLMANLNEVHGRETGDAVLARLGRLIWESLPRHATAGRFANDEFVIFLPHATIETAEPVLKALAARVAAEPWPHGRPVTVSIGLAEHMRGERLDDALVLADAGCVHAKQAGRDGVKAVRPDTFDDATAMSAAGGRSVRRIDRKKLALLERTG